MIAIMVKDVDLMSNIQTLLKNREHHMIERLDELGHAKVLLLDDIYYAKLKETLSHLRLFTLVISSKPIKDVETLAPEKLEGELQTVMDRLLKKASQRPSQVIYQGATLATREPAWMHHYRRALCSAEEAVEMIKDGDTIHLSANAATPLAMERALAAKKASFKNLKLVHVLLAGEDILKAEDEHSPFRHLSLFVGPADRQAVNEGRSEYVPVFLYEIPSLYLERKIPLDMAIV